MAWCLSWEWVGEIDGAGIITVIDRGPFAGSLTPGRAFRRSLALTRSAIDITAGVTLPEAFSEPLSARVRAPGTSFSFSGASTIVATTTATIAAATTAGAVSAARTVFDHGVVHSDTFSSGRKIHGSLALAGSFSSQVGARRSAFSFSLAITSGSIAVATAGATAATATTPTARTVLDHSVVHSDSLAPGRTPHRSLALAGSAIDSAVGAALAESFSETFSDTFASLSLAVASGAMVVATPAATTTIATATTTTSTTGDVINDSMIHSFIRVS